MEYRDEMRSILIECFRLRYSELRPNIKYTAKMIFAPFWSYLDEFQQRDAGGIFKLVVLSDKNIPLRLLDEKTSGNSLQYMLI